MEVRLVGMQFCLAPSLREHLERSLRCAFGAIHDKVLRIVVRLRDLNGSRGGADKLCEVSVTMPGLPEVVIREVQEDLQHAINSAIKRAAYRAVRIISRKQPSVD